MLQQTVPDRNVKNDRLMNNLDDCVRESIEGTVLVNPHLAILGIGNSIVRRDYQEVQHVKLLTGGESGHEPLYTEFIGKGFLTAAIQGEVFRAPSAFDIVNIVKELAYQHFAGILIIIQNNSGDALNFGLAVEKLTSEGVKAKLLIVTDDCSNVFPTNKTDQARGLTGVILVQKIAAALAEQDETINDIYNYCNELSPSTAILTLKSCTGVSESTCICRKHLQENSVEIGGGLHGENHPNRLELTTSDHLSGEVLKEISKNLLLDETNLYVILINNIRVPKLEEGIFVRDIINKLFEKKVKIVRAYVGTFMTSLDMKGFTVTMMKVDELILKYLDYPSEASGWRSIQYPLDATLPLIIKPRVRLLKHPRIKTLGVILTERQANILMIVLQFACDALISCEKQLNIIDGEVGDGDTGSRIKMAAEDILELLACKRINLTCLFALFKKLAEISERIGGTMGAIYGIMFEAAANTMQTFEENEQVGAKMWLDCLTNVIGALKSHTKTEENTNNMLSPLIACAAVIQDNLVTESQLPQLEIFGSAVFAAELAAIDTKQPGKRHPDPGAHAIGIWMRAVYEAVKLRCDF